MSRPKSPKRFFAVLIIACAGAWWYGAWRNPPESAPPPDIQEIKGLVVKLRDLDMGTVWEDDNLQYQLPIENRTGSDIQVIDLIPSCWCTRIEPHSFVVPAGKTEYVTFTLDVTYRVPGVIGLVERDFSVEIVPVLERRMPQGRGWNLHGIAKRPSRNRSSQRHRV